MTSVGEYRRKISKSVRFCSRVVRRTIEGKIFTSTRDDSEHKEVEEGDLKIYNSNVSGSSKTQILESNRYKGRGMDSKMERESGKRKIKN